MHSLILHIISKSHPLWQVHAQSHLTHHIKIPPPRQVHAQSHLTRNLKIPPPLASTCTVSPYTSYQNPTPSGKYMQSLILHVISKSHPLWQLQAQPHFTRHLKIPPPLASTCTVSSYTSYQNPTPSGKYMHSLILHIIYQNPTPSGKYMHSLIFHVISKSHPLWQVHAQSHLTRHIKIPPPLASTCTVSSYTSYQNPTPSGKYMHSLILHPWGKMSERQAAAKDMFENPLKTARENRWHEAAQRKRQLLQSTHPMVDASFRMHEVLHLFLES